MPDTSISTNRPQGNEVLNEVVKNFFYFVQNYFEYNDFKLALRGSRVELRCRTKTDLSGQSYACKLCKRLEYPASYQLIAPVSASNIHVC